MRPLDPERIAYWYFRLNGFLQIENFVVHPPGRGGQRTDADLLAVRFPFRAERLIDDPDDIMKDDYAALSLSDAAVDVVIAEVKTGGECRLNGPWTNPERQNVQRVLSAIGCVPREDLDAAATEIYQSGVFELKESVRIRLVAIANLKSDELSAQYPNVCQIIWQDIAHFIFSRLHRYRRQKTQTDQWAADGKLLKIMVERAEDEQAFIAELLERMGARPS